MRVDADHERLTALDATFLGVEDRCCHMHIGSVGVFEAGQAAGPGGAIDIDQVRHLVSVALERCSALSATGRDDPASRPSGVGR